MCSSLPYGERFGEDQKSNDQVGRPGVCNHPDKGQQLEEIKKNILLIRFYSNSGRHYGHVAI